MNLENFAKFGVKNAVVNGEMIGISPDSFFQEISANGKNFVAVLADYFDENDIEKVFPDEIRENFGFREVKFLLTNAGELFANNEKYGKMLIAEVK